MKTTETENETIKTQSKEIICLLSVTIIWFIFAFILSPHEITPSLPSPLLHMKAPGRGKFLQIGEGAAPPNVEGQQHCAVSSKTVDHHNCPRVII